jgi:hypothetical protein
MLKVLAVLALSTVALADVQITTSYNTDGQAADITISSNTNRMRYEYGNGLVMLRYCDQAKMLQIDEKAKTYLPLPAQDAAKSATGAKLEVKDTGERKELFGHPARHLKILETTEGKKERTETDGWYMDLSVFGSCFSKEPGTDGRGYPASYTITTYGENGKPASTVTMHVTGIMEAKLAANFFEVPADYKDSTPREIPNGSTPKASGTTRVGAVLIRDKSNPSAHNQGYYDRLVRQLLEAKLDLIQLDDGPEEAVDRRAHETACDFVLYTELAVGKPATGKMTGLLHKAPGLGHVTGGDGVEAHIDYRLVPGSGGTPVLASSAVAKAGTQINWKAAAMLASNFIPMAMAARMFSGALNPAMMNALLSGHGSGAAMMGGDPMMSGISMLIQAAMPSPGSAQGGAAQSPEAAEAISSAIDLEAKAVVSQLKPTAK